ERPPLLPPRVVAVGGPIGAGKSTLAARVSDLLHAPVIDADRTRKQMLGVAADTALPGAPFAGAYAPEATERVYRELLRRAARVLASGRSVILDASFRSTSLRAAARELARAHGVPFRFLECRAPGEVLRDRLRRRAAGPSDAGPGL